MVGGGTAWLFAGCAVRAACCTGSLAFGGVRAGFVAREDVPVSFSKSVNPDAAASARCGEVGSPRVSAARLIRRDRFLMNQSFPACDCLKHIRETQAEDVHVILPPGLIGITIIILVTRCAGEFLGQASRCTEKGADASKFFQRKVCLLAI